MFKQDVEAFKNSVGTKQQIFNQTASIKFSQDYNKAEYEVSANVMYNTIVRPKSALTWKENASKLFKKQDIPLRDETLNKYLHNGDFSTLVGAILTNSHDIMPQVNMATRVGIANDHSSQFFYQVHRLKGKSSLLQHSQRLHTKLG